MQLMGTKNDDGRSLRSATQAFPWTLYCRRDVDGSLNVDVEEEGAAGFHGGVG